MIKVRRVLSTSDTTQRNARRREVCTSMSKEERIEMNAERRRRAESRSNDIITSPTPTATSIEPECSSRSNEGTTQPSRLSAESINIPRMPRRDRNYDEASISSTQCLDRNTLREYRSHETISQHLFWDTSGIHRFEFADTAIRDRDRLSQEIQQCYVPNCVKDKCISAFKAEMDDCTSHIFHCAVCGRMILKHGSTTECRPHELRLQNIQCLRLKDEEFQVWSSKPAELQALYNILLVDTTLREAYFLYPDLTTNDCDGLIISACDSCHESILGRNKVGYSKRPQYSVAAGFDFGSPWRLATLLEPLSLAEKCLISKSRIYADIIKLRPPERISDEDCRSLALRGHVLAIPHKGVYQAAEILPRLSADDNIQLFFIGIIISS